MIGLVGQAPADLLEPQRGRLRVDLRLRQDDAVLLDRVPLTLERRRQSLHGLTRRATKHRAEVSAELDQVVCLGGELLHRSPAVLELCPDERAELVELVLGEPDIVCCGLSPGVHLARPALEDGIDRADGLLQRTRARNRLAERVGHQVDGLRQPGTDHRAGGRPQAGRQAHHRGLVLTAGALDASPRLVQLSLNRRRRRLQAWIHLAREADHQSRVATPGHTQPRPHSRATASTTSTQRRSILASSSRSCGHIQ